MHFLILAVDTQQELDDVFVIHSFMPEEKSYQALFVFLMIFLQFFFLKIYVFIHEKHTEAVTQAEEKQALQGPAV